MRQRVRLVLLLGGVLLLASLPVASRVAGRAVGAAEWGALAGVLLGWGAVVAAGGLLAVVLPRVERGATALTAVAEQVGDGDLRRDLPPVVGGFQRQWRAVARMVEALRRVVAALRDAAGENHRVAAALADGGDAARHAASRVADGTREVAGQVATIEGAVARLRADAQAIAELSASLRAGADDGVARHAAMRAAAAGSGAQLAEARRRFAELAAGVTEAMTSVEAVGGTAAEIRDFTALVQRIARQSRLLSLNAAMEAARAGELGEGFTVVAAEVRRLAQLAGDGAERTEGLVRSVLGRVEAARAATAGLAERAAAVTEAVGDGAATLAGVEHAAAAGDAWAAATREASVRSDDLVRDLEGRLAELAAATGDLARVAQDLAETARAQASDAEGQRALGERLRGTATALALVAGQFELPAPRRGEGTAG